jgi:hypothetical protein
MGIVWHLKLLLDYSIHSRFGQRLVGVDGSVSKATRSCIANPGKISCCSYCIGLNPQL